MSPLDLFSMLWMLILRLPSVCEMRPSMSGTLALAIVSHHAFAREVEQHRAGAQVIDVLGVDEVPGLLDQRHVQADEIAALQDLVDRIRPAHLRWQAPSGLYGDVRIVAEHVHAEPNGGVRH